MPEYPLQPLPLRLRKLRTNHGKETGVFRPQAGEHALAEDEVRIPESLVVKSVRGDGGIVDGVAGAEGGGHFAERGRKGGVGG